MTNEPSRTVMFKSRRVRSNTWAQRRSDGVAELKIAHDESVFLIVAWSDDHRIGGLWTVRKPTEDQYGTDFPIEISHGDPVRVRVVDARHQPVANVPLLFTAVTGGHSEMLVGDNPTSCQTTNAIGEAVFAWVPNWPKDRMSVRVAEDSPWRHFRDGDPKPVRDGVHQLEVVPSPPLRTNERVAVEGQLSGLTTDVSGLLMEFLSDQGEEESKEDGFYVRCDGKGRFSARVLAGRRYRVFVNDPDLVSNIWDGVILSRNGTVRRPELTLTKGVPAEVHVTKGRDQKPMENAWVYLEPSHKH